MKRRNSAPTVANLELTELCNVKCSHCYNFWRDESMGQISLTKERLDELLDKLIAAGVFHVVLTGGEPMSRFDLLEHGLKRLQTANISTSVNSNLILADDEKCRRLTAVGLDHILTSLPSCDPATNDQIMHSPGSFEKIMSGIKAAVRNGIRVSVNNVITKKNFHQVYETGKLVASLGAQKLFVTRSVPPTYTQNLVADGYMLTPEETLQALNDAVRVRDEFGIMIGTLVSYPLCFLGDLVKYRDFVGRGCPAQSGNVMSINANGQTHACVHEEEGYGNLFTVSVPQAFSNMRKWHDGGFHYEGCSGCRYIDVCESGCSVTAMAVNGDHNLKDPLFVGKHAFTRHYEVVRDESVPKALAAGEKLYAPKRLRFRQEDGYTLLNIRWANTISVPDDVADFLKRYQASGKPFTAKDFGMERIGFLAGLVYKDAVEAPGLQLDELHTKLGLSISLEALRVPA